MARKDLVSVVVHACDPSSGAVDSMSKDSLLYIVNWRPISQAQEPESKPQNPCTKCWVWWWALVTLAPETWRQKIAGVSWPASLI